MLILYLTYMCLFPYEYVPIKTSEFRAGMSEFAIRISRLWKPRVGQKKRPGPGQKAMATGNCSGMNH